METVFRIGADRKKEAEILQVSQAILEQMGISHLAGVEARALAHGHKRILGIAIAMAAQPKLLLLDEPLSGMNVQEVTDTIGIIEKLWKSGLTILLIEHNMRAAMGLCKKITVINFGKKIAEGTPEEIKQNNDVVRAYLGYREHAA
jgi:branched-chain amino acid transport system ATP-binding protein